MKNLSNHINQCTFQKIFDKKVSLLVDGCKRWGHHYQGAIIFSSERLYLYQIKSVNDSSAQSISKFISDIINDLWNNKTTVISVSTDNFSSNKKAMNNDSASVQSLTNKHMIREPCSTHTGNLAIDDMFQHDDQYVFIVNDMKILMSNLPEGSYREGYCPL